MSTSRELIVLLFEVTNEDVFPSAQNPGLCDSPSEGSVIGQLSEFRLQEEGRYGEQYQGLSHAALATTID